MKSFAVSLLACLALGAVAMPTASARGAAPRVGTPRVTSMKVTPNPDRSSDDSRSPRRQHDSQDKNRRDDSGSSPRAGRKSQLAEMRLLRRTLAEQRKADAQEKAEIQARSDTLYALSQTNAPIIVDAKACRRVGANGESIYENC